MTVKAGDLIWVSDTISDIPDQSYAAGYVMTQDLGENECMVCPDAWIPDYPALPAIARWLEAYPDGLNAVFNWAVGNESGDATDYGAVSAFIHTRDEANRITATPDARGPVAGAEREER